MVGSSPCSRRLVGWSSLVGLILLADPSLALPPRRGTPGRPPAKRPVGERGRTAVPPPALGESPESPSRVDVALALGRLWPRLQACFEEEGAPTPVVLKLTVTSSGHVANAALSGDLAGTPVGDCLTEVARTASLRAFRREKVTITFPFLATAGESAPAAERPRSHRVMGD
jgi:hypothetical protein